MTALGDLSLPGNSACTPNQIETIYRPDTNFLEWRYCENITLPPEDVLWRWETGHRQLTSDEKNVLQSAAAEIRRKKTVPGCNAAHRTEFVHEKWYYTDTYVDAETSLCNRPVAAGILNTANLEATLSSLAKAATPLAPLDFFDTESGELVIKQAPSPTQTAAPVGSDCPETFIDRYTVRWSSSGEWKLLWDECRKPADGQPYKRRQEFRPLTLQQTAQIQTAVTGLVARRPEKICATDPRLVTLRVRNGRNRPQRTFHEAAGVCDPPVGSRPLQNLPALLDTLKQLVPQDVQN